MGFSVHQACRCQLMNSDPLSWSTHSRAKGSIPAIYWGLRLRPGLNIGDVQRIAELYLA
jgi:hypothetical protein